MGKRIKVKQHDSTDCGPACLASVSSFYHQHNSIARIRLLAGTNHHGTNLKGLMEAAKQLGFKVKGVRGPYTCLHKIEKPAIAHLVINKQLQHFVVIYQVKRNGIKIMDPATGQFRELTQELFKQQWTGVLLLLTPGSAFEISKRKESTLRRFWTILKPHKLAFLIALMAAIVHGILGLSTSIYLQKITDQVLIDQNIQLLNSISILMIILVLIKLLIGLLKDFLLLKMGQNLDAQILLEFYERLVSLPQQFFDSMQTGELMSRMNDAVKIRYFINQTFLSILVNVFAVICSFSLMLFYSWKLAIFSLAIVPAYLIIFLITNRLDKRTERSLMQRSAEFECQLVESLSAIRSIKSLGLISEAKARTRTRFKNLLNIAYQSSSNSLLSRASLVSITHLFIICVLWIGSYFVLAKRITPGELLSFYAIIAYVTAPISSLVSSNKTIHNAFVAADRLFEIMDLETHENTINNSLGPAKKGDIRFHNVCFRYHPQSKLFKEINLTILHGTTTAIVGESGTGKSTIMALVQKLYTIQKGRISIGGVNLDEIQLNSLRNHLSIVPQQIELFSGSILENIAICDEHPNQERVLRICSYLELLPFIKSLPQGLDTFIGNNGARLSGGQKQRLAIARALYKPFEVLILDEPTSSLDRVSRSFIYRLMKDLKDRKKTVVIIAHQLDILRAVDSIVFIDDRHSISQGTHQELFDRNGSYRNYWEKQMHPC